MSYQIDDLDKRIIYRLVSDARNTSAPDIAEEMDVSAGTIRNRINRLEDNSIIRGYHAAIDYERCESRLTNLLRCSTSIPEQERLAKRLLQIPSVVNVREMMTGHGNLRVKTVGTSTRDLTRTAQKLTNLGLSVEEGDLIQEEYYHPYHPFGPENPSEEPTSEASNPVDGDEAATVTVATTAPIAGETLQDANQSGLIDEDVLVIAIERNGTTLTPKGDTAIEAGDLVRVFSHNGVSDKILSQFYEDID